MTKNTASGQDFGGFILPPLVCFATFPRLNRPTAQAHNHLSLEEDALRADREILMEVDDNSELIVGNPRGILGQQLMPHTINFLNIIIITYTITLLIW